MSAPAVHHGGLDALQDAFRQNPDAFNAFVAGITAAVTQKVAPEKSLPAPVPTLDKIVELYERLARTKRRTMKNNVLSLRVIVRRVLGETDLSKIPLTSIDKSLVFKYQDQAAAEYTAGAKNELSRMEAMTRALSSTKSAINQARCVFSARGIDMLARYEAAGFSIPQSVRDFLTCKTDGEKQKKAYATPNDPDAVFQGIFREVEAKRLYDPALYIALWTIAGFGLRQRELRDADWSHITERDGELHYQGGIGKNGLVISVTCQERAAEILRQFRKPEGPLVDSRAGLRLNFFLRAHGLDMTQKVAHEVRAFVGAKIFEQQPRAAQAWLRHHSLTVTEGAYANRYAKAPSIPNVL